MLREGEEGAGSGHDRPGACEVRMDGGPLRCWVMVGTPARVLLAWASLTGAPALPPAWALGHHHARWGFGGEQEVRRIVAGYQEHGLPLDAVHLDIDHYDRASGLHRRPGALPETAGARGGAAAGRRYGWCRSSTRRCKAEPGSAVYDDGAAGDAFVRDASGRLVRGVVWPGEARVPGLHGTRACGSGGAALHAERLAQGFAGFWHDMDEPTSFAAFGESTLPRSARHALEGRGGDHREAHNVYGAVHGAGRRTRGCARLAPERAAVPLLPVRVGGDAALRRGLVGRGRPPAGRGCGPRCRWCWGSGCAGCRTRGRTWAAPTASPSPELYLRWLQLGAYLPLFRTHASLRAGRREPWEFGAEVLEHARAALVERRRLLPYFVTLAHLARPDRRAVCAARVVGLAARTGRCGTARTRSCWATVCWWRRCWSRAPTGGRCGLPRGRWYDTATEPGLRGAGAGAGGRPVVADSGARARGCRAAGAGRGRRAGTGGVGAGPGADGRRAGGAGRGRRAGRSRRSSGTSPAGRAGGSSWSGRVEDGVQRAVPPGARTRARRAVTSDVAAFERGPTATVWSGKASSSGRRRRCQPSVSSVARTSAVRSAGRSGRRPKSSR